MPWKRAVCFLALIIFLVFTVRAIHAHSYLGVIMVLFANPATELFSLDLVFSLTLVSIWMVMDARKKGNSYIPFLEITLFFGVAGPLLYLILRDFSIKVQRIEAIFVLLALSIYSLVTFPLADVSKPLAQTQQIEYEQRGQALMQTTAEAHGFAAWQQHQTLTLDARDRWSAKSWWPAPDQDLRMHYLNGTFTSQVTLMNGQRMGETWGIQAWTPYRKQKDDITFTPLTQPTPEIEFYLPTLHYFAELPFRLLEAEHLIYQGEQKHRGKVYDLVLATWGTPQPHEDFDQYQLWINQETQRIDMVHYTVRDANDLFTGFQKNLMRSLALGTIHFDDYRRVDGVWLPFKHTVTLQPPALTRYPLSQHFFHRLEIESASFDAVPAEALQPLLLETTPADQKQRHPNQSS